MAMKYVFNEMIVSTGGKYILPFTRIESAKALDEAATPWSRL
jgi:hypothetical protein